MNGFVVVALSTFVAGVNSVQIGEVHSEAPLVRRDEPSAPVEDGMVHHVDLPSVMEKVALMDILMDPLLFAGVLVFGAFLVFDRTFRKSKEKPSLAIATPILYQKERSEKKKQRLDHPPSDLQATQGSRAAGFVPLNSLRSVRDVLSAVDSQIDRMNLQRIGAVCNRIGKLGRKSDFEYGSSPVIVRLLTRLQSLLDAETDVDVRCRAVAAAIWALAKIGYSGAAETENGTGPLSSLKAQFIDNITHFRIEETTNTIWALSELRRRCDISVLDVAVAVCACKDAWEGYSDEELIFLAWASARVLSLNHIRADARVASGVEHLLELTSNRFSSAEKVASVCPKFTVMLTWALTQFGPSDGTRRLLAAFAESASTSLESFTISEVTALLWALTKNSKFDSPLYDTYKARCVAIDFAGLNSQDMANAVCIFARREVCDDEFLRKLNDAIAARKVSFNPTEARMLGWARKQRPRAFGSRSAAQPDGGAQ
jgi:hypothetical protein